MYDLAVTSPYKTETRHNLRGKPCHHFLYHGLSCEEYDALRARANGHCEICGMAEEDTPRGVLVVDHFQGWRSRFIRGLLCDKCNSGVMSCHDGKKIWGVNRRWQAKAIEYERNSWQEPSELARADMALRVELFRRDDPRYVSAWALYQEAIKTETPPRQWVHLPLTKGPEEIAAKLREHLTPEQLTQVAALIAESRDSGSRVIEQAAMRAAELFAMAEDPDFLGI